MKILSNADRRAHDSHVVENGISRRVQGLLCIALITGLTVRIIYLLHSFYCPDFASPVLDPRLNDYWARALVTGNWTPPVYADDPEICTTPYGRPPGYPYLLAVVYALFDGSYLAPRLAQLGLGLVNVALAFALGRRIFGNAAGIVAAGILAVYWPLVYFEMELNYPVVVVFLTLLTLLCCQRWVHHPTLRMAAGIGAIIGCFALIRPNVLLSGITLAAWMIWAGRRRAMPWRKALINAFALLAACGALITPAVVRNYVVSKEWVLISYYDGVNIYIGNNPQSRGDSARIPDLRDISGLDAWDCFSYPMLVRNLGRKMDGPDFGFSDASRYFRRRAAAFVWEEPFTALRLTVRKALLFWGPIEVSDSKVMELDRQASPLLRWLPGFPSVFAAALLGALLWRRNARRSGSQEPDRTRDAFLECVAFLVLFAVSYFFSILPFFIAGRYRIPVVPILAVFAGYGLVATGAAWRTGDYRRGALSSALLALLYIACATPFASYLPDAATWHLRRAQAHMQAHRDGEALQELASALREDDMNIEAHVLTGFLLDRAGDIEAAIAQYRRALEIDPDHVTACNNLGHALARQGEADEAEALYRRALQWNPWHALACNNLGWLSMEHGRLEEAVGAFTQEITAEPNHARGHYHLGIALARQGKFELSAEHLEAALTRAPGNPDILTDLGLVRARLGQPEQAERRFLEALQRRPDFARAHFNLGNLYGDLGRYEDAARHFEKTLAIDPDFEQARQHLEQVRAAMEKPPND